MKKFFFFVAFVAILFSNIVFADTTNSKASSKKSNDNLNARINVLENQVKSLKKTIARSYNDKNDVESIKRSDIDLLVDMYLTDPHGPAVVTSPAVGVRKSADDASDLMVMISSVTEDLGLLQLRQLMDNYMIEKNIPTPGRPIISLSGGVEGQGTYTRDFKPTEKYGVNLSRAELDIVGEAGPWATAAMNISFDDNPLSGIPGKTIINNSRLRIDRGFLTIGQLNKLPVYLTVGQLYAPFGVYSSNMINNMVTKSLGRTKDRMALLGFFKNGFSARVAAFSGVTKLDKSSNDNEFLGHLAGSLGYGYEFNKIKLNIDAGLLGNLAESDGMQKFVFGDPKFTTQYTLKHNVPAANGRIRVIYEPFTLLAEYVGALRSFDPFDLQYNNNGAKPQAIAIEGSIDFKIREKLNSFAIGYGRTMQALGLKLPKHLFFAEYEIAALKNTIFSVEYRHEINYNFGETANGANNSDHPQLVNVSDNNSRHSNVVTAQLGVYF